MINVFLQIFWNLCFYVFLAMFGTGIFLLNLICFILTPLLPEDTLRKILRKTTDVLLKFYITCQLFTGALRTNRNVLNSFRARNGGALLVANHPSMIDAPIILSQIPGLVCVFKAGLKKNLSFGKTAMALGYLSNDEGIVVLREMANRLTNGEKFLVFPEGTRTEIGNLNPFNRSYALAALRAKVPIQLLCIRSGTPVLSKKQHFLHWAPFPARFSLEMGPVIEPEDFQTANQLNDWVEEWFRHHLDEGVPCMMSYLPVKREVIRNENSMSISFKIPADPFYCQGHMPDNPIVPGFVQMIWARESIEEYSNSGYNELKFTRWKFIQPIHPTDQVSMQIHQDGQRFKIQIERKGEKTTQGNIELIRHE